MRDELWAKLTEFLAGQTATQAASEQALAPLTESSIPLNVGATTAAGEVITGARASAQATLTEAGAIASYMETNNANDSTLIKYTSEIAESTSRMVQALNGLRKDFSALFSGAKATGSASLKEVASAGQYSTYGFADTRGNLQ
jgi:hypothetical protein